MYLSTAEELSSTTFAMCSSIEALVKVISSIPQHPYDQLKYTLFEEGYKFPTINDIIVPEAIQTQTLIKGLEKSFETHQDRVLDYLSSSENCNIQESGNQLTALAELSSNNTYVVTPDKYRMYVEALEVIQGINIRDINKDNCYEIVNKIGYMLLNVFEKKTITG